MVQGMTLPVVITECGTFNDTVNTKDMLAAYVALTRVRTVDTLLLLRISAKQLSSRARHLDHIA